MSKNLNIKNRRASFDFELIDKYEAGMVLKGTEVKSIKEGNAHINEAFCQLKKGELFIVNMYIDDYSFGNINNHKTTRDRKLLLNKREIKQIEKKVKEKGFTIVPIKVFLSERGFIKLLIAVARGKKNHDKRDSIKDKDLKREADRALRNYKF